MIASASVERLGAGEGQDAYVYVPQGPGLGVELNEEVVEKYRVRT